MDWLWRVVVLILGLIGGVVCIKYNYQLTRLFGYNSLAEQYIGTAGTYTMWRVLGAIIIVGAVLFAFR